MGGSLLGLVGVNTGVFLVHPSWFGLNNFNERRLFLMGVLCGATAIFNKVFVTYRLNTKHWCENSACLWVGVLRCAGRWLSA